MKKTYFTPGPAELYPTVEQHYQNAFELQLGSISHRSAQFRKIYQHTVEQLRILLNIPPTSGIFFTGSATEIWERIIMNTVEHESFHLVNGSFSKKFHELIVCCNVLLYFTPSIRSAVLRRLADALNPGGYLFLGHADGAVPSTESFEPRSTPDAFVYRKR